MCPFCLATMGLIVAGAASTGGLAALAVKLSSKKNGAGEIPPNSNRVGVGIMIAHNPLHGSGQAGFPHPALALGNDAHAA